MPPPPLPFSAIAWTPELASLYGETMAAIGRLDARISASSLAPAWALRASWSGYATALKLQRYEIDEIDTFSHFTGVPIAGHPPVATAGSPFGAYVEWKRRLTGNHGRHWREDLPFTFDPPGSWDKAPPLVRALTVLDMWSRKDPTIDVWLAGPPLFRRMEICTSTLPCLVAGDLALRTLHGPREAQFKRILKSLEAAATKGLGRLAGLEDWHLRFASTIAEERRPGLLKDLATLALSRPVLSATVIAREFEITVSGAGKLLARAAGKRLLVETSGRSSWRLYVTPDVGVALGMLAPRRGRPPSPPRPSPELDAVLADFDREMAEIDALLSGQTQEAN